MHCEACRTENRAGSRFCDHCGAPLSQRCPACGDSNRADARFCATCGGPVATDTDAAVRPALQPAAERRQVSVLFTDLVGFTAFADGRDPERVRSVQQRYFDAATEVITRHGGLVEKFVGDAVMAVWGTPVAHEDDAQRAVRAGLELVKSVESLGHELRARAGIVTGEAAVTVGATNQGIVAGDMVNTAARLQAAADPGQVLADHATKQAADAVIAFEPVEAVALKGKTEPVPAWRALRVQPARAGDLVEAPFVGRADELRRLKELLLATGRERRSRLVSITGPAGIGKSRLVQELGSFADGLAEPVYWHAGRSPSYGEGLAFWALGEMVRRRTGLAEGDDEATTRERVAATLGEFVASLQEREWLEPSLLALLGIGDASGSESHFGAWRSFFERIAERGSVVLVFEDLQWADSGTVEFIEHVLDWSRNQPLLVITLGRPELLDARPGWATGRSHATAIALDPMTDAEMRELLSGLLPGLAEEVLTTILHRAEGMPLYAVEMVRSLLAEGRVERRGDAYAPTGDLHDVPLPASLRSLIAARLDALDADDRGLLQHAAVLGQTFSLEALASVTARDASDIEPRLRRLVRREVLEIEADSRSPERGQYRFVQSLIREVGYDTLSLAERRSRHLAAARYLEAAVSEEAAGALASHYLAAYRASDDGPEADAVAAQARVSLRAAADRAAALGAHEQAVQNVEHALEITSEGAERAELLVRAASSAAIAALPNADAFARAAVEAYRALGDRNGMLKATALLGDVLLDAARIPEAVDVLQAAVDGFGDRATWGEGEATVLAMQSRALMRMEQNDASIAAADAALIISEHQELHRVTTAALTNKGSALSQAGRYVEGLALLGAAIDLAQRNGWSHLELRGRGNYGMTQSDADPMGALETYSEMVEIAERIGDVAQFVSGTTVLVDFLLAAGRRQSWERASELIERALPLATPGVDRVVLWAGRTSSRALRGHDIREDLVTMDRYIDESTDPRAQPTRHMLRAVSHHVAGRWPEAHAAVLEAIEVDPWAALWVGYIGVTAAAISGDTAAIERIIEVAEGVPRAGPWARANRTVLRAVEATAHGRTMEATDLFHQAAETYRELGVLLDLANAGHVAATILPDVRALDGLVADARAVFDDIGAVPMVEQIDRAVAAGAVSAAGPRVTDAGASPARSS